VLLSHTVRLVVRKLATVALLPALGLIAGHVLTYPVPGSYVYVASFGLPGPTHGRDAAHLAAVVKSQHVRGIRVKVFSEREFEVSGHGSSASAAVRAVSTVRKALYRIPHLRYNVVAGAVDALRRGQVYPLQPAAIGVACGVAVGILIGFGPGLWSNQLRARIGRLRRSAKGYRTTGTA
jgi:hypothetical protein